MQHRILLPLFALLLLSQCTLKHIIKKNPGQLIHGSVAPGFEPVKQQFIENFISHGEKGAALAVYYNGKMVVDLWGGYRNASDRSPWEDSTMVMVFSTTKGMAALSLALAGSRGYFDYDDKVAKHWPEFATQGKENITIRQLLAHEAGLVIIKPSLDIDMLTNHDSIAHILAQQTPSWAPGQKHGYHLSSMGLYMNELMRQVDPLHRTIGQFFQQEIAKPLNARFYIGLPDTVPQKHVAQIIFPNLFYAVAHFNDIPKATRKKAINRKSMLNQAFLSPHGFNPNSRESQKIEMPSGNGIGTARALAKIYYEFAIGAPTLNFSQTTWQEITQPAQLPPAGATDQVMGIPTHFLLGFLKPGKEISFGASQKAFGTPGAGGSFAFADPNKNLGYAYVMNKMGLHLKDDPRELALRKTVYQCIEQKEKRSSLPQYQE